MFFVAESNRKDIPVLKYFLLLDSAMGNEASKDKSTKGQAKHAVVTSGGKTLDSTKNVLLLYNPSSENTSEIIDYFCDVLNQVKPPGCVAIESKNAVNLSEHDEEMIKNRTSQWLTNPHSVVLLCLGGGGLTRESFVDGSGTLPSKIFPVCFGTGIPSEWPEAYSIGLANPEKAKRPNDFEGDGLDTLVAAIRGVE